MSVEVVLHQDDFFGVGKVDIGEFLEYLRVIEGGAAVGDLDVPLSFERCKHHKEIGGAVDHIHNRSVWAAPPP